VVGDHHTEYRVAEELQALVGFEAAALIGVGTVGERQREKLGVKLDAERGE
jgi:hypothetical protein